MAIDFPTSPTNGQTYTFGSRTWSWNGVAWDAITTTYGPTGPTGPASTVTGPTGTFTINSSTPPSSPSNGQAWLDTADGRQYVYYDDGDSSQWVEVGSSLAGPTGPTGAASTVTGPTGATGPTGPTGPASTVTGPTGPAGGGATISTTLPSGLGTSSAGSGTSASAYDHVHTSIAPAGTLTTATSGVGYMGMPQVLNPTSPYTILISDAGKQIYMTTTGGTITIPANSTTAFPIGSTLVIINAAAVSTTISITTDTLILAGTGTTGSRTLAAYGMATLVKITSTSWMISGNGLT